MPANSKSTAGTKSATKKDLRRTFLAPDVLAARLRLSRNQIATLQRLRARADASKWRKVFYGPKRPRPVAPTKAGKAPAPSLARIPASFDLVATPAARRIVDALVKKRHSKLRIVPSSAGQPAKLVSGVGGVEIGEIRVERMPEKPGAAGSHLPQIKVEDIGNAKIRVTYFVPRSPIQLRSAATMHEGPSTRWSYQPSSGSQATTQKQAKSQKSSRSGGGEEAASVSSAATGSAGQQAQSGLGDFITQLVTAAAAKDFLELGASPIEDVAFYDFSDYVFMREPEYHLPPPPQPDVAPVEVPITDDLEQQGINANDMHYFSVRFRQAYNARIAEWSSAQYGSPPNAGQLPFYSGAFDRVYGLLNSIPDTLATFTAIFFALPDESGKQEYLKWVIDEYTKLGSGSTLNFWMLASGMFPMAMNSYSDAQLVGQWLSMEGRALDEWSDYSPYAEASTGGATWTSLLASLPAGTELPTEYPFAYYAPGTANLGVRLVYRQTWRPLGNQRGELVKTIPLGPRQTERVSTRIVRRQKVSRSSEDLKSTETTTETSDSSKDSSEVVREAASSFGWSVEASASMSVGYASASLSAGARGSSDQRSKNTSQKLSESMQRSASKIRTETKVVVSTESEITTEEARASEITNPNDEIAVTYVFSRLQRQYQVLTQLSEAQNVILVAERLPEPYELTDEWVRRHDWILAKALLDDSFRPILTQISQEYLADSGASAKLTEDMEGMMRSTVGHLGKMAEKTTNLSLASTDVVSGSQSGYREAARDALQQKKEQAAALMQRARFRQHIADNLLHYCRAIWSQEDPQQRLLRYRKLDIRVPLDWKFVGTIGDMTTTFDLSVAAQALAAAGVAGTPAEAIGEFQADSSTGTACVADLIAVEGPLGYVGNYVVFGLKPRPGADEFLSLFDILKSPYVEYETVGSETLAKLIDPTFREYKEKFSGGAPANKEEQEQMADAVPDLRRKLFDAKLAGVAAEATYWSNAALFQSYYPEFLYRRDHARRLALDTNNLVLDLLPGEGSTLESFKRAHRIIDVLKADEERTKMSLENDRRRELIDGSELGNPEAQKTFVVVDKSLLP